MPDGDADRLTLVIATGHALSLALLAGGECIAQSRQDIEKGHAEALMPAIEDLLKPFGGGRAPVGRIVVETGPGSFTGLRVGLAAARALGVAWGVPVQGVRSTRLVEAEARASGEEGPLLVALAAPRGQIWSEAFDADGESMGHPVARQPRDVRDAIAAGQKIVGSAAATLGATGSEGPHASAFRWLADAPPEPVELLYVRQEGS